MKILSLSKDYFKYSRHIFEGISTIVVKEDDAFNHPSQGWIIDYGSGKKTLNNDFIECYMTEDIIYYSTGPVGVIRFTSQSINETSEKITLTN